MATPALRVAAVVVTHNRLALLRRCLCCLAACRAACAPGAALDIWVIDNQSTDGTAEALPALAAQNPALFYRPTGANLGGAGGFAWGLQTAAAHAYDFYWLLDDDTLPEPCALAALLAADAALGGGYGWLSSRALTPQGADQPMNRQRATPYRDIIYTDAPQIPSVMASFVSLLVPGAVLRAFGLPVAEFFIWSDDWEYTRRISRKLPCYTVPASRVVHAMARTTPCNIALDTPDRWERYRYFYRNDVVLYRREGLRGWAWLLAKDAWHSAQVLTKPGGRKLWRLGVIWGGFAAGVRFFPKTPMLPGGGA